MRCTFASLVLATLAIGQATASAITHAHAHLHNAARRHDHVE
jgi:hydroxymethylpyrimidine/phosphomethylpyrimidine kinase